MSFAHNNCARAIARSLLFALPRTEFHLLQNRGYLRASNASMYLPDVAVVPIAITEHLNRDPTLFETYDDSVPFVAEVWSPPVGSFEVDSKFLTYQLQGDAEIWRVHPFERTVTIWRRQPDGSYEEKLLRCGTVGLHALPSVSISVDELFVSGYQRRTDISRRRRSCDPTADNCAIAIEP